MARALDKVVSDTEYILRETIAKFKRPAISWSGGKDSTVLVHIAKNCLYDKVPPCVFIDTTFQFRETYEYLDRMAKKWDLELIKSRNEDALMKGISPYNSTHMECCTRLKTYALNDIIRKRGIDAYITGIRWDEQAVRGKDYHYSEREDPPHTRVNALAHWYLEDIWNYVEKNNLELNPLYGRGYKSLGCYTCSKKATSLESDEREGREQDKIMERLRQLGYF